MITIDHMHFEVIENYRDAFDEEQFQEKYSEVLNKYDYIVGDIGYEKLRLAGFFRDNKTKADRDKKFSAAQDYLYEYCNFGCAYFVLRKVPKSVIKEMVENGELEAPSEEDTEPDSAETVDGESETSETADGKTIEETAETEAETKEPESASEDSSRQDEADYKKPVQKQPQQKRKNQSRGRKKPNQQKQKQNDKSGASTKTLAEHQSFNKS